MKLKHPRTLLIVTGGPGTGKSYAAKRILSEIDGLELLSYDDIKEIEFDRFGFDNAKQKDRLNWFSLEEFYLTLQKMMWQGKTILIEYPFYQRHRDRLAELIDVYQYRAITVLLYGDWKIIYERGKKRDANRQVKRHPGHLTNCYHKENAVPSQAPATDASLTYEEFRADIDRKNYDIQLGSTIRMDVTDFSKVDFSELFQSIRECDEDEKL